MTAKKAQHVVRSPNGGWSVKKEGSDKATKTFKTQAEAIDRAKEIAKSQQTEMVVHSKDGRINYKNSYGNDPNPPKDKK